MTACDHWQGHPGGWTWRGKNVCMAGQLSRLRLCHSLELDLRERQVQEEASFHSRAWMKTKKIGQYLNVG